MREKLSLTIPVYNEEEVILQFLKETRAVLETLDVDHEFVFVDDGSSDQTVPILREEASKDPRLKLVVLSYNHGKAYAATAAFSYATGDYLLYMDPDLQDPPTEIPKFLAAIREGNDLVWGVRREKADSPLNRLQSRAFWGTLNRYTDLNLPQGIAVMRMFTREFADALLSFGETNRFLEGLFVRVGMRQTTIQIDQRERFAGESKFNFHKKMKLALDAIFDFSELPLQIAARVGFLLILVGVFSLIGLFIARIFITFETGWPSIVALIGIGAGLQLFFLGMISIYLGRIYRESKRRPLFSVQETFNLTENR